MARPRKYKTPESLNEAIQAYKDSLDEKYIPTTGMMLQYLGLSRETWREYHHFKTYVDTIKKAEDWIEDKKIEALVNNTNVTGLIFDLKNNYGWTDRTEVKQEVTATMTIEEFFKDGNIKA